MHPLHRLLARTPRLVAGLMSGTSLDGIDVVVAVLEGSGRSLQIDLKAFVSMPYSPDLRVLLLQNSAVETSSVRDLSQLNVRLAHAYAAAVRQAIEQAGLRLDQLDLIGSHGQTVHHVPEAADCAGLPVTSTLQIGDPSVLANLLGVPVVGDFRVADMALGGQGAPLVPYFDYVCFSHTQETRGLLNIGGIANLTVLPAGAGPEAVQAFDTGPGNMVCDALARHFLGTPFDPDGQHAARGRVLEPLLADLLDDPYYAQPPPKSTGREQYTARYVADLIQRGEALGAHPDDLLATAAALTVRTIHLGYTRWFQPRSPLDVLIVSGGGQHNRLLMAGLQAVFAPIPVRTATEYGVPSDAKEALCFAVLAHETVNGVPTNLPRVTGAREGTLLGKLCLPALR